MAVLEQSSAEALGASTHAIRISLGSREARVHLTLGPIGHEHGKNTVSSFGAAGWLALSRTQVQANVAQSGDEEKRPFRSGFVIGTELQAVLYISGADPKEIGFKAVPSTDLLEGLEDELGQLEVVHEEGKFERPLGVWVPGTEPTRWDAYTNRDVLRGIPGIDPVLVYSAEEVVRRYVNDRPHQ